MAAIVAVGAIVEFEIDRDGTKQEATVSDVTAGGGALMTVSFTSKLGRSVTQMLGFPAPNEAYPRPWALKGAAGAAAPAPAAAALSIEERDRLRFAKQGVPAAGPEMYLSGLPTDQERATRAAGVLEKSSSASASARPRSTGRDPRTASREARSGGDKRSEEGSSRGHSSRDSRGSRDGGGGGGGGGGGSGGGGVSSSSATKYVLRSKVASYPIK